MRIQLLEKDIQKQILTFLHLHKVTAWRRNSGGAYYEFKGRKQFVRFSSMKGESDISGLLAPTGRRLEIEVKRPGEKPTPDQIAFIELINSQGGKAFVAYSVDDVKKELGL